jgi:hypothetical protein
MQKIGVFKPRQYGITPEYCFYETTLVQQGIKAPFINRLYDLSIELVREIVRECYR